jgi:hypothetical protein
MNTAAVRARTWPVYAIPVAIVLAFAGMLLTATLHAQIGESMLLQSVIAASIVTALIGAVGGLVLASTRRNVMWILAVALSTTALLALIAIVLASLAA